MEPYLWLFLKMFPWMLLSGGVGLLIGWAVRSSRLDSRTGRLEAELEKAQAGCSQAREQETKLRDKNRKQEKRLQRLEKDTAPREQLEQTRARLEELEAKIGQLTRERNAARVELEGFREAAVSGAEHSELKRLLEKRETEIRKARKEAEKSARELTALQAREVHDLVGFEDDRDDRIREFTLENARLREILARVQAGDKKSILQLADEARQGAAAAAAVVDPTVVAELRDENTRLSGELETAKKKLLQAKTGGAVDSGSMSLTVERERDALKVELARLRAGGTGAVDSGQQAEIAALKKERDRLLLELVEARAATEAPVQGKAEQNSGPQSGGEEQAGDEAQA